MTTSFGSICLGSFIVAVIQLIRTMVQFAARGKANWYAVDFYIIASRDMLLGDDGTLRSYHVIILFLAVPVS